MATGALVFPKRPISHQMVLVGFPEPPGWLERQDHRRQPATTTYPQQKHSI